MKLVSQSTSVRLLCPLPTPGALAEGGWVGQQACPSRPQGPPSAHDLLLFPLQLLRLKEAAGHWL